jgi:UDP-N-acetylmuramate--alanine ligase
MFHTIRKIHFVGIGGSGMSGVAEVLVTHGYEVSGSDTKASPVTERLSSLGARVHIGHDAAHAEGAQVVVVSSAIARHNPETLAAQAARVPIIHRSEMLAELMRLKAGVIVAGTHGKTTTTSILATVLTHAGLDPTIVIGGRLNSLDSSAKLGQGELFVAEADESDGSFLRLTPTIAVLTNIDRDHMDHYASLEAIIDAFKMFVDKIPFYGALCACYDDPLVQGILPAVRRRLVTYGLRLDADVTARDIEFSGFETRFTPVILGREAPRVRLRMPGRYNVSNALASYAVAHVLELDVEKVGKAIDAFEGVLHRFTVVGEEARVMVVDDYAHNPKKIATLLEGIRESFPERHVCAVFQPHRYSRVSHLADEFAVSFKDADTVIVTPIYAAGELPLPGATQDALAARIASGSFDGSSASVKQATDLAEAARLASDICLSAAGEGGAIIVTMGAGDVRNVGTRSLECLRAAIPR